MSSHLILDWDPQQVRLLVCGRQSGTVRVHDAQAATLEGDLNASNLAKAFKPLVEKHQGGKYTVIALTGGRDLQCRLLRMPPAPEDELPDMVRLRASSEFPLADESAVIDFYPLDEGNGRVTSNRGGDASPKRVLAARLPENSVKLAREVCNKLGLTLDHLAMRGCGLATLASSQLSELQTGVHLVAAQRPGEMDLVALENGVASVVRSVTLTTSGDRTTDVENIARELRRTIPAVNSELESEGVKSILWLTGTDDGEQVATKIGAKLDREVQALDLRNAASIDANKWPADAAVFAAAVGTAEKAQTGKLSMDFLAPRKRVEKETPKRTLALAGALAALVLLGGVWMVYSSVASVERAAQNDIDERQTIESDIEQLATEKRQSEQVAAWLATDVNWLDEIDHLAVTLRPKPLDDEDFEADNDVRLESLTATKAAGNRGTGGTIALSGGVRDDEVLSQLEQNLRDDRRQVNSKNVLSDPENAPYVWTFQSDLIITPPSERPRQETKQ